MRKVLVYVDAENISVEKLDEFVSILEESRKSDEIVIGKFYGSHCVLGDILQRCYSEGYEYVDTYAMSASRKNVTDMKIVVDCIFDVTSTYFGSVSRVYVVSADHDFIPLAYKLKGQHCEVIMPFLDSVIEQKTCADLSRYLDQINFDLTVRERLLENPFYMIKDKVQDEFPDDVIEAFIAKKRKKIVTDLLKWVGSTKAESVAEIPIVDFCYSKIKHALNVTGDDCYTLFDIYTKKMYGLCLPRTIATEQLIMEGVC